MLCDSITTATLATSVLLSQILRTSMFYQHVRPTQFLSIEFSLLVFVQPVELLSHKPHPFLLRDLAVLAWLHQK